MKSPKAIPKISKKKPVVVAPRKRAKDVATGLVSRIGQPDGRGGFYTREAYTNSGRTEGASLGRANSLVATDLVKSHTAALAAAEKIATLQTQNAVLTAQVGTLTEKLAATDTYLLKAVASAKLRERAKTSGLVQAALEQGMNHAVRLMHMKPVRGLIHSAKEKGESSTSHSSFGRTPKSAKQRVETDSEEEEDDDDDM